MIRFDTIKKKIEKLEAIKTPQEVKLMILKAVDMEHVMKHVPYGSKIVKILKGISMDDL
jgi:hypothetical protein